MNKLELLIKYSGKSKAKCQGAIKSAKDGFFQVLYELSIPEESKEDLIKKLSISEPDKCKEILDTIINFYSPDILMEAIMDCISDNSAFPEDVKNNLSYKKQEPTQTELEKYNDLLNTDNLELIRKTMKIISNIPTHCRPLVKSLKQLLNHTDRDIYDIAIDTFIYIPDCIGECISEFIELLKSKDHHKRFCVVRALSREETPIFEETIPYIKKIIDDDLQIADMAKEILIRYSPALEWQIAEKFEKKTKRREKAMKAQFKNFTTEELHSYALDYNWDEGVEYLKAIIQQANCDILTAIYIYWGGKPRWYAQYSSTDEMQVYERDKFSLLQEIERNVEKGRYISTGIKWFDENDFRYNLFKDFYEGIDEVRTIPEFMYPLNY